ncbi:MAG: GGDEF domain-containing protein [Desulfamplus sp.]|nr:GGDEF domain-containing protein [Desulfamplus sp.]
MSKDITNQEIPADYQGQLLYGNYSQHLRCRVFELFNTLHKVESVDPPVIPYLAAWNEMEEKIIWYEFSGKKLLALLNCTPDKAAERFRKAVVDRRIYCYNDLDHKIKEEITLSSDLEGQCQGLREEVKMTGCVDAIYQLSINDRLFWVKDQARIEIFSHDHICLSLGFLTDMTKEMEQKTLVEKIGYFDELTSLPRRLIMDRIFEINIGLYTRGRIDNFVFMMIDIDYFKKVNDTFGHLAGDYILAALADLMSSSKRKEDEIGRYGGEEFFCFSLGSIDNGLVFAERLRKKVEQHTFVFEGNRIAITISVGVVAATQFNDQEISAEKMVEYADRSLYKVKQSGRNSVMLFQGM